MLACIGAAARDRWKLLVPPVLLCLLAWPVALLTMWLYPARLWAWWVD